MEPMKPMAPMQPMKPMTFADPWWPAELGQPSSAGSQNAMRYAVFTEKRRLLVEEGGRLSTYDTGEHQISGISQGDRQSGSLSFSSQQGPVRLDTLKQID